MPRKKAFSGKQKKEQMKEKRDRKREHGDEPGEARIILDQDSKDISEKAAATASGTATTSVKRKSPLEALGLKLQPGRSLRPILFEDDTRQEVEARKLAANLPLDLSRRVTGPIESEQLNLLALPIPKRPAWTFETTPEQLEKQENEHFDQWLSGLLTTYPRKSLNYFECNLETWRQMWRVCERSQVILIVTDARYPLFHFSTSLYEYVKKDMGKPIILVLNKIDIADPETVEQWSKYFIDNYGIKVVKFSSFKGFTTELPEYDVTERRAAVKKNVLRGPAKYATSQGQDAILQLIRECAAEFLARCPEQARPVDSKGQKKFVVGSIGSPNVGKSSVINALSGTKVVSVSRTPGHTKHFQTIHLSEDIVLCDCPGMVFPALDRPKHLQILCGLYPLPHMREPYTALRYVAEHLPLEDIYKLHEHRTDPDVPWSPLSLAEAFAKKSGYVTGKAGRPDVHKYVVIYAILSAPLTTAELLSKC
eukprot:TRINITY_DN6003_c0_g1_i1.p1 TRINITY_DN6003_c0_g1~~TRINITY_DN6003_c0_g1_i1.p1  ORF type:complete len:498 (-),score=122.79 TRINITY_DN6003_c0_g1_i1:259-1698(-)